MAQKRTTTTPDAYGQQPQGRANIYNQTYIGFVRKVEDDNKMGRLKVFIPDLGGDSDREESWYVVDYCSPFAGATPIKKYDNNRDTAWKNGNIKDGKKYTESQVSYGWWAVPPDIDNQVIIMFINGDPNKGIWLGALYHQFMNHMVPGIPVNESFDEAACDAEEPPVGEYNKFSEIGNNDDPTRPRYDPLHDGLKMQGLYTDEQRGTATSGARRESPSLVYGLLTPDGQQLYADDNQENEFIRFRTKSGVQVLIHETCGYVYMNSKKGNSWVQISDSSIDIYSTKHVNVRAHDGINMHTDKDFNLHVAGNFNAFVGGDTKWGTAGNWDQLTAKDHKLDIGGALHSTIKKNRTIKIEGADSLNVAGNITQNTDKILTMTSTGLTLVKAAMIKMNCSDTPNEPEVPAEAQVKDPCVLPDRTLEECYPESTTASVVTILPTHEPYKGHESACSGEAYLVADCSGSGSEEEDTPGDEEEPDNIDNPNEETPEEETPEEETPEDDEDNPDNTDDPNDNSSGGGGGGGSSGGGGGGGSSGGGGGSSSGGGGGGSSGGGSSSGGSSGGTGIPNTSHTSNNGSQDIQDAVAASAGSDATGGYSSSSPAGGQPSQNLTNKSLDQIDALQTAMKNNPSNTTGDTGVGRYNLSQPQVQAAKAGLGKSGSDKFSASTQDAMASWVLKQTKLPQYQGGKVEVGETIDNLAETFPTLPTTTGKTPSGGDPLIPLEVIKEILEGIRNPVKEKPIEETTTPVVPSAINKLCLGIVRSGANVGTGTVIDYSGTMVTNAQVIGVLRAKIGQFLTVEIGDRTRVARLVALNAAKDIAHIRLFDFKDLIPIDRAGYSGNAELRAFGFAFGQTLTEVPGTNSGQTNKSVKYTGPGNPPNGLLVYGLTVMNTTSNAGIRPGMAGGPVLDPAGNMIGIIAASTAGVNTAYYVPY